MENEKETDYGQQDHSPQNKESRTNKEHNETGSDGNAAGFRDHQLADSYDFDERNYNDTVEDFDLIPNMSSRKADDRNKRIEIPNDTNNEVTDRDNDPYRTPGL